MKNISEYQNKNQLFNLHLTMAGEVNKNFKSKFYKDIIEHEQDILTGKDKNGNELHFNELIEDFTELKKKLEINGQKKDIIRILMAYLYSYNINQNKFDEMTNQLNQEEKKIFEGLKLLNLKCNDNEDSKLYKRNYLELNDDINDLKSKYNNVRAKNKIISIIEDCVRNNLDKKEFQFIEEPKNIKYKTNAMKKKKLNKFEEVSNINNDIDDLNDINKGGLSQLLIYFNIGGLSINEISSIRNFSKNNELGFKIILGSTGIYSSNQYLKELISLVDNKNNEDINEDEDEDEDENKDEIEEKGKNIIEPKKVKDEIYIEISNKIDNNNEKNEENNIENNNVIIEVKEKEEKKKNKKEEKSKKDKKGKEKEKKKKEKKKKENKKIKKIKDDEEDEKDQEA